MEPFRVVAPQVQNTANEKRMARICWNDNGWVFPSGRQGKSIDKNSHEGKYGYGHEEWLMDTSKLINGYHYGFLEPIRKQQAAYVGRTYDVWLYAIDGISKKRYWLGEIKNVIPVDAAEAATAKAQYIANGWLQEMEAQIRSSNANPTGFSNFKGVDLFNIKFRLEDVQFRDYVELPSMHPVRNLSRYSFHHYSNEYGVQQNDVQPGFSFLPPGNNGQQMPNPLRSTTYQRQPKAVEITNLHRVISDQLVAQLRSLHGHDNVTPEHPVGNGKTRIDIVVNNNGCLTFYEIKTYASLQTSIREAIGQILEYAYWPGEQRAKKLIVVTQKHGDEKEALAYFTHIRTLFGMNIFYQSFDPNL